MILEVVLLVVGVGVVVVSADRMVPATASLASRWGVSPVIVGAVIIGFGSSLPEMVVSVLALDQPNGLDLAVGNAVGSNIANISLVLAISVIFYPFGGQSGVIKREGVLMAFALGLSSLLLWDGNLTVVEGVILMVALAISAAIVVSLSREEEPGAIENETDSDDANERSTLFLGSIALISLVFLLAGARAMVLGAEGLAQRFGLSEGIVGLTILALGTSLPELGTVVASARRGRNDLVLGNVLGSNIFNALGVVGIAGVFGPGSLVTNFRPDLVVMMAVALMAGVVAWSGDRLRRIEGFALLAAYPAAIFLAL